MQNTSSISSSGNSSTGITHELRGHRPSPALALPSLKSILENTGPLPREALFLGMAEDDLPVLLNIYDPIPGPILITGDQGSGKTNLLRMIASGIEHMHNPTEMQFNVITPAPDEWIQLRKCKTNAGIYSTTEEITSELLQSLVNLAHNNQGEQRSILLLIDGLDKLIQGNGLTEQNLRWLLLRGPSHRVWPITTLNAGNAADLLDWLGFFHTRFFGFTSDPAHACSVTGQTGISLDHLTAGSQFTLREGEGWLIFRSFPSE